MSINLKNISLQIKDKTLVTNSDLILNNGSKYGVLGYNGSGKTTLLKHISLRKFDIPDDITIYYIGQEEEKLDKDKSIYQMVLEANKEKYDLIMRLEEIDTFLENPQLIDNYNEETLMKEYEDIHEKLNNLSYHKDESIIKKILYGLGFSNEDMNKSYSKFSGGFKMRCSIAKGLYLQPHILLLDEVNNHLDLNSMIWLTDYLSKKWLNTLMIVSHDTNFLNEVCTHIIHLNNNKLVYHVGNYDKFLINQQQEEVSRAKKWKIIENKVKEMKAKSLPSKEVEKLLKQNEHLKPQKPYKVSIKFNMTCELNNPLIELKDVSFSYDNNRPLFKNINFPICNGDKYVLVGANGVGKSSLIKLIADKIKFNNGEIYKNNRLKIGYYDQQFEDIENNSQITPIEYIQSLDSSLNEQKIRQLLGTIGLPGQTHKNPILLLSGGQKARLQFVVLCVNKPHLLLLDEPTNHLDIETIDALIEGIKAYDGTMIIITHNIDLINKIDARVILLKDNKLDEINFYDYYEQIINESD